MTKVILITGAQNGLGQEIAEKFQKEGGWEVIRTISDIRNFTAFQDELEVYAKSCCTEFANSQAIDVLVNCAGVNRIDYIEDMEEENWDLVMDTNAKGIFNVTKAALPYLKNSTFPGAVLNIVSNASHMPMTSSIAYNASKGAAHIMTLQMNRELKKRHNIDVFGISPNKLAGTEMSKYIDNRVPEQRGWTPEQAKQYQLNSLNAGEETDPKVLASFIHYLLHNKENHKFLTGCIIPYGA